MAEFAGYVGNLVPPTDWGKIGTDLFDKYNKVKEEREAKREKIDNDFTEAFAKIGDYEQTTDQSVNELVSRGANDIRDSFKTQYDLLKKGAITMSDYKLYKNTSMSDWSTFNKGVKTFGANIANAQKVITDGKMSGFGQYNMLNYAKLGDLKNARIMPNPQTGRLYLAQVDPKTGTIASDNDVYSPSAMLNPGNLVDLKVDINDGVTTFLKRVADYGVSIDKGSGKILNIEDARKNPAFTKALDAQVNAMTVTPRSTTSVLTDYVGDYQFFESEAQKKELIAKGTPAGNLIKVERKNGVYEPVPTEDQEKVAKDYVRNQVEVGVGYKETRTQGFAPQQPREVKPPSVYDKKEADKLQEITTKAETANKIWAARKNSPQWPLLRSAASDRGLDSPKITFVSQRDSSGHPLPPIIRITGNEMIVDAGGNRKKGGLVTRNLRSAEDVYTYLSTKQDPLNASEDYIEGNKNFEFNKGGSSAPEKTSSNVKIVTMDMIRQQVKNSGKPVTQENIDAYTNQLESTGKFKVQR